MLKTECTFVTSTVVVEQYDVFEAGLPGRKDGNPYTDYTIRGRFTSEQETVHADGFYDGDGIYRIRFMPSHAGRYAWHVEGSFSDTPYDGSFLVKPAGPGNHGPVHVADRHHFSHADGTPYLPFGTTCYVWTHQPEAVRQRTLQTLSKSPFNKIRFCVIPKHYIFNLTDPVSFPYEGTPCDRSGITEASFQYNGELPGNHWDFTRFNTAHFQAFEEDIRSLMNLGIEADIIVMHPYDCWGFCRMTAEQDDLYWRYVVARLSAFRNVWWSLANEYDFMQEKKESDWERFAEILVSHDPYARLRSIHNGPRFYDHTRSWVTHCSVQSSEVARTQEWLSQYDKPVIFDEMCYEGDIDQGWGNITAEEMSHRCWEVALRGGYIGHGETYVFPAASHCGARGPSVADSQDPRAQEGDVKAETGPEADAQRYLSWSHGNVLHGDSPARIAFLQDVLASVPGKRLRPMSLTWDIACAVPEDPTWQDRYKLLYLGNRRPSFRNFHFDVTHRYRVEIIDTWHMTIRDAGTFEGWFKVRLPSRQYIALRITRLDDPTPSP